MRDIRLLTLYKQHYLDAYDQCMNCKITCLGYYDGLDLTKVEEQKSDKTFIKKEMASITELWYSTGKRVEQLLGGYSNQNIGLFRCIEDEESEKHAVTFWNLEKNLPFFSVAFLKLKKFNKYEEIGKKIEKIIQQEQDRKETCIALSYCTFDNSDLVILLKGNSISEIQNSLEKIDRVDEVVYLHSILGIEEEFLKYCFAQKKIVDIWNGTICCINEAIHRAEFHLTTRLTEGSLSDIKTELDQCNCEWMISGYQNMKYSYVAGHSNINLVIRDTDVRSLLVFFLPGGFATHQNPVYEKGVYNIETSIFIKQEPLGPAGGRTFQIDKEDEEKQTYWCRKLIGKYRKYCNDKLKNADEGLYSYYQALIQTLIALDQYECFSMSRDVFEMIYPSFCMFDRKIDSILNSIGNDSPVKMEQLKEMICNYLECVNSIVYHTIHTEQVFLMIPGYSGTSFSIPIKLNIFYLCYIYKVIDLLNDCGKLHSCIVVPVMESRPETRIIGSDFENEEKLVHVRLSQRSLFHPRSLMIILAHEIAHYIGRGIRLRSDRMDCILKTMSYYITEGICPENDFQISIDVSSSKYYVTMKNIIKQQMQGRLINYFIRKIGELNIEEYYTKDIYKPLMQWLVDVFDEECGDDPVIYYLIEEIVDVIPAEMQQSEDYIDNMRFLYQLQQYLHQNRCKMIHTAVMQRICRELIAIYKEVFADITAIAILDCSKEEFQNAFVVSEGYETEAKFKGGPQWLREKIVERVIFHEKQSDPKQALPYNMKKNQQSSLDELLQDNFYDYSWLNQQLEIYANKCYKNITEYLAEKDTALMKEIRSFYRLFEAQGNNYSQIYACISKCMLDYREIIEKYK